MTFTDMDSFIEWCIGIEEIDVMETNFPEDNQKWITIENIENTNPLHLTEVILSAYDSGFHLGSFFADRYNGTLTIYE